MRAFGAGLAAVGVLTAMIWGVTAGSSPEAVLGGFTVPLSGLGAVIVGLFVWMAGMAKAERAEAREWAKLGPGFSSLPQIRIYRTAEASADTGSFERLTV